MKQGKVNENGYETEIGRSFYEPVYTIGIAAIKSGTASHTLRLYEKEGLILPFKTETGRRIYSDLEIEKVKCIQMMIKEKGMNFAGIRRIIALVPCWKLRNCNANNKQRCLAYKHREIPCWTSKEKCAHPMSSCRECDVYKKISTCEDVQRWIEY